MKLKIPKTLKSKDILKFCVTSMTSSDKNYIKFPKNLKYQILSNIKITKIKYYKTVKIINISGNIWYNIDIK